MLLYGCDERGWKVQYSWGKEWGDDGVMIVPYNMNVHEKLAVTDEIIEHISIKKPFKFNYLKIFVSIINFILNFFKQ